MEHKIVWRTNSTPSKRWIYECKNTQNGVRERTFIGIFLFILLKNIKKFGKHSPILLFIALITNHNYF